MDRPEQLVTKIIAGLVANKVLVWTRKHGLILATGFAGLAASAVETLLELLLTASTRIISAVRERHPEDTLMGVICREIVAIGSESLDVIVESVMAVIAFLRRLMNMAGDAFERFGERGANFTQRLGQRSLDFTSVSSVRRNY